MRRHRSASLQVPKRNASVRRSCDCCRIASRACRAIVCLPQLPGRAAAAHAAPPPSRDAPDESRWSKRRGTCGDESPAVHAGVQRTRQRGRFRWKKGNRVRVLREFIPARGYWRGVCLVERKGLILL
eukprot:scaffold1247_cov251-Pinguiococcus_pyrenoidosus.AAC.32